MQQRKMDRAYIMTVQVSVVVQQLKMNVVYVMEMVHLVVMMVMLQVKSLIGTVMKMVFLIITMIIKIMVL